ncbi:MAG: FxLYD domain-containing protein [Candidatus Margulisiibacteriota bacterium]
MTVNLVGEVKIGMKDYKNPYFYGTIKNKGNKTVDHANIIFKAYDSTDRIMDLAVGDLAKYKDIKPGEEVDFEAVCFQLSSVNQIKRYEHSIFYLDKT